MLHFIVGTLVLGLPSMLLSGGTSCPKIPQMFDPFSELKMNIKHQNTFMLCS